jgi:hypothetical protein
MHRIWLDQAPGAYEVSQQKEDGASQVVFEP